VQTWSFYSISVLVDPPKADAPNPERTPSSKTLAAIIEQRYVQQMKLKKINYDISIYSNRTNRNFYCLCPISFTHQKRHKKIQIYFVPRTVFYCYLGCYLLLFTEIIM
jgi:hypothetical protein